MTDGWPADWSARFSGVACSFCANPRADDNGYGLRILAGEYADAHLQRAAIQRGYTIVAWHGRHVVEPTDLTATEAAGYWLEILRVARALRQHFKPLKMNYETLGNNEPHLHTHLIPRYAVDVAPGRPFPLPVLDGTQGEVSEDTLREDVAALRVLLGSAP